MESSNNLVSLGLPSLRVREVEVFGRVLCVNKNVSMNGRHAPGSYIERQMMKRTTGMVRKVELQSNG